MNILWDINLINFNLKNFALFEKYGKQNCLAMDIYKLFSAEKRTICIILIKI